MEYIDPGNLTNALPANSILPNYLDGNHDPEVDARIRYASTLAQIAMAQQLKRIADELEQN